jgi:hypothetical protein
MGAITDIQKALDGALKDFGIANSIAVALTNINAATNASQPFLASSQIPTGVGSAELGGRDLRNGFYQVDIYYKSHVGTSHHNKMADLLNATFKSGACFYHNGVCVSIDSCEPTQILINNGWGVLPLDITWSSYTARL